MRTGGRGLVVSVARVERGRMRKRKGKQQLSSLPHPICSQGNIYGASACPTPTHSIPPHRPWNQMPLRTHESPPGSHGCYTINWLASFLSLICWGTSRAWPCPCPYVSIQTAYRSFRGERHLHKHNKVPLTQGSCLAKICP